METVTKDLWVTAVSCSNSQTFLQACWIQQSIFTRVIHNLECGLNQNLKQRTLILSIHWEICTSIYLSNVCNIRHFSRFQHCPHRLRRPPCHFHCMKMVLQAYETAVHQKSFANRQTSGNKGTLSSSWACINEQSWKQIISMVMRSAWISLK